MGSCQVREEVTGVSGFMAKLGFLVLERKGLVGINDYLKNSCIILYKMHHLIILTRIMFMTLMSGEWKEYVMMWQNIYSWHSIL